MVNAAVRLWVRAELRRHRAAVFLLCVLVVAGGGAAVASVAAARRTDTAFDRLVVATRTPNVWVSAMGDQGVGDLDPTLLDRVMQIDGVTGAEAEAFVGVAAEDYPNFFALAVIDSRGESMRPIVLDGSDIGSAHDLRADEVLINEAMRDQLGKGVGDTVELHSYTEAQFFDSFDQGAEVGTPAGPRINARIVGVGRSPEDVSDAPDPFFQLSPAFFAQYSNEVGNCRCIVAVNADPRRVDEVTARLAEIYPDAEIEGAEDLDARVADAVELQRSVWWIIALAAAIAGGVAVLQAAARFAATLVAGDDTRQALGMTPRECQVGRFVILATVAVVGAVGSAGLAYVLSPVAPVGLTRRAEPRNGLRWDSTAILLGSAAVLLASLAVSAAAVVLVRRRRQRVRRVVAIGGPVISLGGQLALGPGRGAIAGVLIGTAGLVGGYTLQHSVDHVLATPALYGADFDASSMIDNGDDKRAVAEELSADPDIEAVALIWVERPGDDETLLRVVGPRGTAEVQPNAIESVDGTISVRQTQGRTPTASDEVAVGAAVLEELGAAIGDRIVATGVNGDVTLTIVGDNLDPGVDVADQGFTMTLEGLDAVVHTAIEGAVARFVPGADEAAVLARHANAVLQPVEPPSEVGNIGQLGGLPGMLGQLLATLGVLALITAALLTFRQSRHQLAIQRALGFTAAQVLAAHFCQAGLTAVIGVVAGGGLGFVVGRAVQHELITSVGAIPETIVPDTVWAVAVGAFAVCAVMALAIARFAMRQEAASVLRAE